MANPVGTEARYQQLNRIYQSALRRSNWSQIEAGQQTPAEKVAVRIADLNRRCNRRGPNPDFDHDREEVAVAASHFLNDEFSASAYWANLRTRVALNVAMDILRRDQS